MKSFLFQMRSEISADWRRSRPGGKSHIVLAALFTLSSAQQSRSDCTAPTGSDTSCYVQYKVAAASLSKCGFDEYVHLDLPRLHKYHQQLFNETYNEQTATSGTTTSTQDVTFTCVGGDR